MIKSEKYNTTDSKQESERFLQALSWCHNILRSQEGMTTERAFRELLKLLFVKYVWENDEVRGKDYQFAIHGGKVIYPESRFPLVFEDVVEVFKDEKLFDYTEDITAHYSTCLDVMAVLQGVDFSKGKPETAIAFNSFVEKVLRGIGNVPIIPQTLVNYIIDIMEIRPSDSIVDPFCNYGSLLSGVASKRTEENKGQLLGYDKDQMMLQTAKMNLLLHGDTKGKLETMPKDKNIYQHQFDYVLTCISQGDDIEQDVWKALELLKDNGTAMMVVPDSLLLKDTFYQFRHDLTRRATIQAIVSLPLNAVRWGDKRVKTSMMFLNVKPRRDNEMTLLAKTERIGVSELGLPSKANDLMKIESVLCQWLHNGAMTQGENVMWAHLNMLDEWNIEAEFSKWENRYVTKYPQYRLGDLVRIIPDSVYNYSQDSYKQVTVRQKQRDVVLRDTIMAKDIKYLNRQTIVHQGQVLVSRIGAKDGAIGIVPPKLNGAIVSDNYIPLTIINNAIDPYYLLMVLTSERYNKILKGISRGVTNRSYIKNEDLLNLIVPVPDIAVQRQMVKSLEETQQKISELEQKWSDGIKFFSKELFGI